jgi:hypothetical protein
MSSDKQKLINQFFFMTRNLKRTANDIIEIRNFFYSVSEITKYTPPTVEFMAVLKVYRPVLFHEFRKSLVPNTSMWFLASVNMNSGDALINLGVTNDEQLQQLIKG